MKQVVFKIVGVLGALLVVYVIYQVHSSVKNANRVRTEAANLIAEYEQLKNMQAQFELQNEVIQAERNRCTDYVRQNSGNFSEFEYCKRFLNVTASE